MSESKDKNTRAWEVRDLVMSALGISLIVGGTVILTPNFPIVLGLILEIIDKIKNPNTSKSISKAKVQRVLKNLEKQEILSLSQNNDTVLVHLRGRYNTKILKYSIKKLLDFKKSKKKWSGKWYLVFFDVPEIQRNKRNYLRRFLTSIGFYPYQKSVYLFPYECEKEIKLIKQIVESSKYMSYVVAEKIEHEAKARSFFNI
ncbi:MAG: CRISPR-associated endonuclease Cas2 [Patescibacteria group bacterium]